MYGLALKKSPSRLLHIAAVSGHEICNKLDRRCMGVCYAVHRLHFKCKRLLTVGMPWPILCIALKLTYYA